jgi:hypothetical protein
MSSNNEPRTGSIPQIKPTSPEETQVIPRGRDILMYSITDVELEVLEDNYQSWNQGFCAICLGLFIGFLTPLLTVVLSTKMQAIFLALVFASGLLGIYFGVTFYRDRKKAQRRIKQIRERPE